MTASPTRRPAPPRTASWAGPERDPAAQRLRHQPRRAGAATGAPRGGPGTGAAGGTDGGGASGGVVGGRRRRACERRTAAAGDPGVAARSSRRPSRPGSASGSPSARTGQLGAELRQPAGDGCLVLGRGVDCPCATLGSRADPPACRSPPVDSRAPERAVDVGAAGRAGRSAARGHADGQHPRARRGRRGRRRARRTTPRGPRGWRPAASARCSASCAARSGLARWATPTSTGWSPAACHRQLLQPGQRRAGRADLLERGHPAVLDLQQRLDRQRAPEQRGRGADPAAAAQVLQGVDVEQRRRRGGPARRGRGGLLGACRPRRRTSAAASTAKPVATPTCRLSTARR